MGIGRRFSVILDPWPEGNGFTVTVPALAGCVTQGHTREEALDRVQEAIAVYIESLEAHGEPIPVEAAPPELAAVEV